MSASMSRRNFMKAAAVGGGVLLGLAACDDGGTGGGEGGEGQLGGTLTMYTPNSETLVNNLIPAFEEKTGITVELIQAGTGELFKKLQSEAANPIADVLWGGAGDMYASNADLFQEYVSSEDEGVIEDYRNSDGFSTHYSLDGSVFILNKELTAGMDIKGYADLLNPDLTGKIATADPANSSSAFHHLTQMLLDMGGYESDEAWDYVRQLFTLIQGKITSSSSNVYKTVADGEMAVGLSYEDPCVQLVNDGANVEVVYPEEGTIFLPANTAIIKDCANPDQAKAWIDFIVSQEAQNIIATSTTSRPVRADVDLNDAMKPMDEINTAIEDEAYVNEHKDEIVARYTEIYTSIQSQ
ncbi:substrate-binding domain-containing protein [Thermophilibacter provencensis]|uniref:Substrate-binding domain-containing protein n=1 Tax=Thermophilibacter provencensis TaxID=1852386 RepID=A0ABT7V3N9_9ACTN|nr:substrate-binding domain-containing protein [Thermophilibacter provencensis]MDM8270621.1 substrate-binding domain-containing protein [Thermophilibacter provencensis]